MTTLSEDIAIFRIMHRVHKLLPKGSEECFMKSISRECVNSGCDKLVNSFSIEANPTRERFDYMLKEALKLMVKDTKCNSVIEMLKQL